jgi:hypothetical protein
MGDDHNSPPLARRVPGAARAAPSASERPVLPEALLQRMQAVVRAAHAQAAAEQDEEEQEQQQEQQAARAEPSRSLPRRMRAAGNGRKLPPAMAPPGLPTSSPVGWSDAFDDTSPLPRLTASGAMASPGVNHSSVQPDRATKHDRTARSNGAVKPDHALRLDHALRPDHGAKRDRHAAKRERFAQPEHQRLAAAVRAPADLLEHPRPVAREAPRRRRTAAIVAAAAVLIAAVPLAIALSSQGSKSASGARGRAVAPPVLAAAWVARQVSRTATVACDPVMCRALTARGMDRLLVLTPTAQDPRRSQVIVATAAVRKELRGRLNSVYAPAVIASFGSGTARIDVRVIAANGAAAFWSGFRTDLLARKASGTYLLSSPRIKASATARRQLTAGQVDTRLLIVISALAGRRPFDVLAFGDSGPGASAGMPLRSVDLAEPGGAASMRAILAQLPVTLPAWFLAAHTETTVLAGHTVLQIEFPAPEPPGLISPQN